MQDNNFKSSQHPLAHYWCNRTKFHLGASWLHQDMGTFQICSFLTSSWEGNLDFNLTVSSWGPQDLCSYFNMKGGGFLAWPPTCSSSSISGPIGMAMHSSAPALTYLNPPRHSPACFVGRQGHSELSNLGPHEVQWKLLLSFKMQLNGKRWMLCSSPQEVGYKIHSPLWERIQTTIAHLPKGV